MHSWLAQHESVTIEPDAAHWRCRPLPIDTPGSTDAAHHPARFRAQLGLPTDRPIVMSGHQPAIWHAGIAAKVFALAAAARRFNAAPAWIVVDQDTGDPARIAYPVARIDTPGAPTRLARGTIDLLPPAAPNTISARQPAAGPRPLELDKGADPSVSAALERMSAALGPHTAAPSRAMQVTRAALALLAPQAAHAANIPLISATALAGTDLFGALIDRMRADPASCVALYNNSVAAHPKARMRQLASCSRRGPELPLWSITPSGKREPVFAADLDAPASGPTRPTLAPRALTMTALLRWAGCDLFIHGLGGGRYDPIMESWLASWLGVTNLAPAVVVSATRLLPLVDHPPPTPEGVARAVWAAHHARHDPGLAAALAGNGAHPTSTPAKHERIAAIAAATGPDRLTRYRALHDWVDHQRAALAPALAVLESRAADLRARSRASGIVFDRTWPAPLLPEASLASLRSEVDRRIGG